MFVCLWIVPVRLRCFVFGCLFKHVLVVVLFGGGGGGGVFVYFLLISMLFRFYCFFFRFDIRVLLCVFVCCCFV